MSERGRGGRGRSSNEHRSYEDYDDAYATPRSRNGRYPYQYGGPRAAKFDVPPAGQPYYPPYAANGGREYTGPPGPSYGHPAWAQGRPSRAPYMTPQQRQQQYPESAAFEEQRPNTERGTRWSGGAGGYGQSRSYARPPSSTGGNGRPPSAGRPSASGGGGRAPSASSSGGGARQPSTGRGGSGNGSSGSGSGGGPSSSNPNTSRSRSTSRTAGSGRSRAPYVAPPEPQLALTAAPASDVPPEPELPSNPHFLTPAFPQPPRTRTDSCSTWALMVEASCQTLEAVVGPFLEGVLMELFGETWERELFNLDMSLPPFTAAACADLVSRCKQLHERLPITIHKRVEAVQKATAALATSPASLDPDDVAAAQLAMKGMLQDCIKAMKMPSLLGAGSRQFRAFTVELLPHAESTLLYYDMLIADCSEAAAARQQTRGASAGEAAATSPSLALIVASP